MSLINEALKKAQKMRSEPQAGAHPYAPPPSAPPPPVAPPPSRRDDSPAQPGGYSGKSVAYIAGGAGLLACISILATVLILRRPASPEPTSAEPAQAQREPVSAAAAQSSPAVQTAEPVRASTPVPTAVAPVAASPVQAAATRPQVEPAQARPQSEGAVQARLSTPPKPVEQPQANFLPEGPRITLPVASAPRVEPAATPPQQQAPAAAPTGQAASVSAPASPFAPAPLPPEKPLIQLPASIGGPAAPQAHQELSLEQACQQFVNKTRISGIRPGVKVLVNSRAYKPGDVVEAILGLRLVEIGQDHLVFTDAAGRRYTRNF